MSTLCEKCFIEPKLEGKRFCKACKKEVLRIMRESGYLQPHHTHAKRHPLEDSRLMDMDHILERISSGIEGTRRMRSGYANKNRRFKKKP